MGVERLLKGYPLTVALRLALSKYLLSRLSFIIPDKHFLISYYGGKIYLNLKESSMMLNKALGVYEFWKTKLFFDIVKEGMTVVDVGVHKGYFSLLFAKLMNDKGRVLSFEPDSGNSFWFQKSVQANKYKCIMLYQCALSDSNGEATFYPGEESRYGSLFASYASAPEKEPVIVRTRTLDDVLQEEGISSVDIMKIDVEGADLLVLKGAKKTLQASQNLKIAMDVDLKGKEQREQLFDLLTLCGYQIFKIGKTLEPIEKIDETVWDIYAEKRE